MKEKQVKNLLRALRYITATAEHADNTILDSSVGLYQGLDEVDTMPAVTRSISGEFRYTVAINLYNPTRDQKGNKSVSIVPCDKCGMKGRRAADKNDNRDSIFHEADCPYQIEQDIEETEFKEALETG